MGGESKGSWPSRDIETSSVHVGIGVESQSPFGIKSSKACEGQQERLTQVHWEQNQGKSGPTNKGGKSPKTKDTKKSRGTQYSLCLCLYLQDQSANIPSHRVNWENQGKGDLVPVEEDKIREHLDKVNLHEPIGSAGIHM